MSWEYTYANGKQMRRGYTTGSCAAAAAKAAVLMLFGAEKPDKVSINTPKGIELTLDVYNICQNSDGVSCSVQKDSGDDPDITNGIHVFAAVKAIDKQGIEIDAGEGVGMVTKPGLQVTVGKPAINPVPMKMIIREIEQVLPKGKGVKVVISIPEGTELAKKTLNPRLGIIGGLSILGTTGIVEPMSEEAFKDSLAVELKMALLNDNETIVLVPGNHGMDICRDKLSIPVERIIKMSNFVGFMLDKCREYGVKKVLMVGHIGKLLKVSAGIFHTHSRVADARFEIFAANACLLGASSEMIRKMEKSVTTEEMVEILDQLNSGDIYGLFAEKISRRSEQHVFGELTVGTVLFSFNIGILGMDNNAKIILEEL